MKLLHDLILFHGPRVRKLFGDGDKELALAELRHRVQQGLLQCILVTGGVFSSSDYRDLLSKAVGTESRVYKRKPLPIEIQCAEHDYYNQLMLQADMPRFLIH